MSRCFPYPPPGYCRNGAAHEALIESIKLQKETDKSKTERRKEKKAKKEKKEKKKEEKEKRKKDEKLKLQKNQSQDSHKLLHKVAGFTEAQIKGIKTNTELLERSDLTEEHGQPIKPCYSSDSTQNSNKRRRDGDDDDVLPPDDSTGHGKSIKIRLLKKHKGSDSSNSGVDANSKTVPLVSSSNLDRPLLVSSNRSNGVPATSGRENNSAQGIPLTQTKSTSGRENSAAQGVPLTQTKSNRCYERTTDRNPNGLHLSREQSLLVSSAKPIFSSGSRKSDVEVIKSSRQQPLQQIGSIARPVVPQSHLKLEAPSSSSVVSRNIGVQGPNSVGLQQGPSNLNLKPGIPGPVIDKPSLVSRGKRPINEITVPGESGPTKAQKKEDTKKVGPTRSEKKMLKKQAKYEKLIGSWVPPVFQALLPDVVNDDEDWLSRRTKPANSSISKGEVESCREVPTSLWQARARFLAEADVYALPYTVPF